MGPAVQGTGATNLVAMKTTLSSRQIANPRRTTLAHLKDASELVASRLQAAQDTEVTGGGATGGAQEQDTETVRLLPRRTANPRRTILTELPKPHTAS